MASLNWFPGVVLGLETSCDETSAALVSGSEVLGLVVSSQADLHRKWGGIVPEAASRAHVEALLPTLDELFTASGVARTDISGIAVTNRPGLVGALSVGVTAAKALAMAWDVPYVGVHHLEGHILSVLQDSSAVPFPHACLIVSGGHTELVWVAGPGEYKIVAETLDDAAGEAFDKGARLLGLGYPGGYRIQEAAKSGDPTRYSLPQGVKGDPYHFSFSGLKTAVLRLVEREGDKLSVPDAAASLQHAIVEALVGKAVDAAGSLGAAALTLVGGVAANERLRLRLSESCERQGIQFFTPPLELCTDNAAMIAFAGSLRLSRGERADWSLDAIPNAPLPE